MQGFQLSFLAEQDRRIGHQPVKDWLLDAARDLGISGCTVFSGVESYGAGGRRHSAGFFELADQPLEVVMAVTAQQAEQLFARLDALDTRLFYIKTPVEFGAVGGASLKP
jgi:PII-like signaling protein